MPTEDVTAGPNRFAFEDEKEAIKIALGQLCCRDTKFTNEVILSDSQPANIFLHNEDLNQERIQDFKKQQTQISNKGEAVDSAFSNIADWPWPEAVAEFGLRTGHDYLAKHLHRMGVYAQPTCLLCDLQEEMEKTQSIRCPAL
nr:hypothetical transcript [Hymenolepis microstoma]